jgi:exopolysaccharide biosynthesis polyprenyl glycosylphosphotransferase
MTAVEGRSQRTSTSRRLRPLAAVRSTAVRGTGRRLALAEGWPEPALMVCGDLAAVLVTARSLTGQASASAVAVAALVASALLRLYRPRLVLSVLDDLPRLLGATGAGIGVAVTVRAMLSPAGTVATPPERLWVLWPAIAATVVALRCVSYRLLRLRRRVRRGSPVLILGVTRIGRDLGQVLAERHEFGLRPVGYLDDVPAVPGPLPAPLLGTHADLPRILSAGRIRYVVVAFGAIRPAALVDMLRECDRMGCRTLVVPRLYELPRRSMDTDIVRGIPLTWRRSALSRPTWPLKRLVDVVGAAAGMLVLWPLMLLCALAVRLEGGPGTLFRQVRVSQHGRLFDMLKFRSLKPAGPEEAATRWSVAGDDRIGPVGRVLRARSLDELPQLVNVLRGEMSLVGPRPERPHFVQRFTWLYRGYAARHQVPAGVTGWAAVHGLRGDTCIAERVRFDNDYIENWSLWFDVKVMLRTIGALLTRSGG